MGIIYWTGYSNKERVEVLTEIEKYIKKYGRLSNFKSFSGISVSFSIDIGEQNLKPLFDELSEYVRLDDFAMPEVNEKTARVVVFNLSFVDG